MVSHYTNYAIPAPWSTGYFSEIKTWNPKSILQVLTTLHTIKKDVTAKFLVQPEYRCYWACNKTTVQPTTSYSEWRSTSFPPEYNLTISQYNLLYTFSNHESQSSFFPSNIRAFSMDYLSTSSTCTSEQKAVITEHNMKMHGVSCLFAFNERKYCSTLTYNTSAPDGVGQLHAMTIVCSEEL
jgi:hypothetical protein